MNTSQNHACFVLCCCWAPNDKTVFQPPLTRTTAHSYTSAYTDGIPEALWHPAQLQRNLFHQNSLRTHKPPLHKRPVPETYTSPTHKLQVPNSSTRLKIIYHDVHICKDVKTASSEWQLALISLPSVEPLYTVVVIQLNFINILHYSSFHFLFRYPYITPIYYSSFHFIFHYPKP